MPRIVHRYILKEIFLVFWISLGTFTFVLLVAKIFTFTDLVVNKGVSPVALIHLIAYKLPYFFVFTFPMSVLIATLVTFLRLSHDHEITALKASGISLYQLLPPVLVLSMFAYLTSTVMAVYLMPKGNRAFRGLVYELTQRKAYIGITPRIFIDDFKGMVLYVNNVDTTGRTLENVFIADERDSELSHAIVAQKGLVLSNAEHKTLALRLIDGEIHYDSKDLKSSDTIQFQTYQLALDLPQFSHDSAPGQPDQGEMPLKELWRKIRTAEVRDAKYNMMLMDFHEKFSLPLSCLILGLIGLSLAVQSTDHSYAAGVTMALGIFLLYYVLLSAARSFGESGALPPALGAWMPNLMFGALSAVMFVRACHETPMKSLVTLTRLAEQARSLFEARS